MHRTIRAAVSLLLLAAIMSTPISAGASSSTDWPGYLYSTRHGSRSASTAITPATTASLTRAWSFSAEAATLPGQPAPWFDASPTVFGGRVYIGANTGVF